VESIRASIEVRASIDEALRRWSECALALSPRQVDFESVASTGSRVTVEAYAWLDSGAVQRELERQLRAFKRSLEQGPDVGAGMP
jgi:hypothetical protein